MINENIKKGITTWFDFERYLKKKNRFKLTPKWEDFITLVVNSIIIKEYSKDTKLYRARRGCKKNERNDPIEPFSWKDLAVPSIYKTKAGRANPIGVQNFYLAISPEVAIAETRPMLDEIISIAIYKLKTTVKLIDARLISTRRDDFVSGIWEGIYNAFSYPCTSEIEKIEYIPSQYLSEIFRFNNYDGIVYGSSKRWGGQNIVLFDYKKTIKFERDWSKVINSSYKLQPLSKTWK